MPGQVSADDVAIKLRVAGVKPNVLVQQECPCRGERERLLPVAADQLPVERLHRRTCRQTQDRRGSGIEERLDEIGGRGGHLFGVRGDDDLHQLSSPSQPDYSRAETSVVLAPVMKILLNIQRARGDTTSADQLVRRFTDQFWHKDWPGSSKPAVYYDPRSLNPSGPTGVLHAKAVVVDDEAVFITSANLTESALDRNIELGVLIRHRVLATSVANHFQALIDTQLLSPLPTS